MRLILWVAAHTHTGEGNSYPLPDFVRVVEVKVKPNETQALEELSNRPIWLILPLEGVERKSGSISLQHRRLGQIGSSRLGMALSRFKIGKVACRLQALPADSTVGQVLAELEVGPEVAQALLALPPTQYAPTNCMSAMSLKGMQDQD